MLTFLFVFQIIIAVFMTIVILLQRNQGDSLTGLGGGSPDSILSGRASANLMTKTTAVLAALFMINSLLMGMIVSRQQGFAESLGKKPSASSTQNTQQKTTPSHGKEGATPLSVPLAQ